MPDIFKSSSAALATITVLDVELGQTAMARLFSTSAFLIVSAITN